MSSTDFSSLTKDYGSWGTSLDIMNPKVWILIIGGLAIIIIVIKMIELFKR